MATHSLDQELVTHSGLNWEAVPHQSGQGSGSTDLTKSGSTDLTKSDSTDLTKSGSTDFTREFLSQSGLVRCTTAGIRERCPSLVKRGFLSLVKRVVPLSGQGSCGTQLQQGSCATR